MRCMALYIVSPQAEGCHQPVWADCQRGIARLPLTPRHTQLRVACHYLTSRSGV